MGEGIFKAPYALTDQFSLTIDLTIQGRVYPGATLKVDNGITIELSLGHRRLHIGKTVSFTSPVLGYSVAHGCTVHGSTIIVGVLVTPANLNKDDRADAVYCVIPELTAYLDNSEVRGAFPTLTYEFSHFSVDEIIESSKHGKIRIKSEHIGKYSSNLTKSETQIIIICEMIDSAADIMSVPSLANDVRHILSLVYGRQLTLERVFIDGTDCSVLFPCSNNSQQRALAPHETLIVNRADYPWGKILSKFFSQDKPELKVFWIRLLYLNELGTWEYSLFASVGMLDWYSANINRHDPPKISNREGNRLVKHLKSALNTFKGQLDSPNVDFYSEVSREIVYLKSARSTFKKNLKNALEETYQPLIQALDISDEDLDRIVKIRNAVAHGRGVDLTEPGYITQEMTLYNKIRALLCYWFLTEIGFSDKRTALSFTRSFHPILRSLDINHQPIHRALGTKLFFKSGDVGAQYGFSNLVVFLDHENMRYEVSYEMSFELMTKRAHSNHSDIMDVIAPIAFAKGHKRVSYMDSIYLCDESDTKQQCILVSGVIAVDYSGLAEHTCRHRTL